MSAFGLALTPMKLRQRRVLPGFGLSLGFTIFYLTVIVLIPLMALVIRPFAWALAASGRRSPRRGCWPRCACPSAWRLLAAVIDTFFGFIIAWVLVRYRFPGKGLLDALIDLPFALPTAVAGIALSTLYAPNGWIGAHPDPVWHPHRLYALGRAGGDDLHRPAFHGAHPAAGDERAVRQDVEEAAATLGATRAQTIFRVVVPMLLPAIADRRGHGLCPRRGRIWLDHLPGRQSAHDQRDRAAADHHQAGTI